MQSLRLFLLLVTAWTLSPVTALGLGFDGRTVGLQVFFPTTSSPATNLLTAQVGPGVEFPNLANFGIPPLVPANVSVDLTDFSIIWDFSVVSPGEFQVAPFDGYIFSDPLDQLPDFAAVTVDPFANALGLDSTRIMVTPDEILVNVGGLSFSTSTTAKLDVQFVPEPSTAGFLCLGLASIALYARRPTRLQLTGPQGAPIDVW